MVHACSCGRCGERTRAEQSVKVIAPPSVLVLQLLRGQSAPNGRSFKDSRRVSFDPTLDLSPVMALASCHQSLSYRLVSAICHSGGSLNEGHYVCYANTNGRWYYVNDAVSTLVSFEEVSRQEVYVLLYERMEVAGRSCTSAAVPMRTLRTERAVQPLRVPSAPSDMPGRKQCAPPDGWTDVVRKQVH